MSGGQPYREVLDRLAAGGTLDETLATEAMNRVMEGKASPTFVAAFLMGLRVKGETVDVIVGCARAIRARALPFVGSRTDLVDTCGTGGDGAGTFNVSTAAAFVAAGAGVAVAKHGNRAVSSRTGSADVLEALGVEIGMNGADAAAALDAAGITFLFAPTFHAAMRHAAPVRRELGVRTVLNLLGPLCNPAGATAQVVGVFDGALVRPLAEALARLGTRRAIVVHGLDGLDELTVTGPSRVAEWDGATVREYTVDPASLGLPTRRAEELCGGDPTVNARILRAVLDGGATGAARDIVLLNAAATLVVAERVPDLREGLDRARESVDSGAARQRLEALVAFSSRLRSRPGRRASDSPVPETAPGWGR